MPSENFGYRLPANDAQVENQDGHPIAESKVETHR